MEEHGASYASNASNDVKKDMFASRAETMDCFASTVEDPINYLLVPRLVEVEQKFELNDQSNQTSEIQTTLDDPKSSLENKGLDLPHIINNVIIITVIIITVFIVHHVILGKFFLIVITSVVISVTFLDLLTPTQCSNKRTLHRRYYNLVD